MRKADKELNVQFPVEADVLHFQTKKRVDSAELHKMLETRYDKHESIECVKRPALRNLGKRPKPVELGNGANPRVATAGKPVAPVHEVPMAITNVAPLNIQQIKENLRVIQRASRKPISPAQLLMNEKVAALRDKMENIMRTDIPQHESVLETQLTAEERETLKYMLRSEHQERIETHYP